MGVHLTGVLLDVSGGESWNAVFAMLAGVCAVGATVFVLLGTGERLF